MAAKTKKAPRVEDRTGREPEPAEVYVPPNMEDGPEGYLHTGDED